MGFLKPITEFCPENLDTTKSMILGSMMCEFYL